MADLFWNRWKREYLALQQLRKKWQKSVRNLQEGDTVKDEDLFRNQWPMAEVITAHADDDGLVRTVELKFVNAKSTVNLYCSLNVVCVCLSV